MSLNNFVFPFYGRSKNAFATAILEEQNPPSHLLKCPQFAQKFAHGNKLFSTVVQCPFSYSFPSGSELLAAAAAKDVPLTWFVCLRGVIDSWPGSFGFPICFPKGGKIQNYNVKTVDRRPILVMSVWCWGSTVCRGAPLQDFELLVN